MNNADQDIVLFDGVCNLCSASVRFIIARDPAQRYLFASLQSAAGARHARAHGVDSTHLSSVVLIRGDHVYLESTAALRICLHLRRPWPALAVGLLLPTGLRDAIYRLIARNRYRLFGRRDSCWAPNTRHQNRFLD